jgi:GNAT superfamily N-acetyltransferase
VLRIVELPERDAFHQIDNLSDLLIDAVQGGASVSFMAGLKREEAGAFWRSIIDGIAGGETHLFAALEESSLLGVVLLHPCMKPNQPHRADVAKMLVLRSARRRGIASKLLEALETRARQLGRTLLTLDTAAGSTAEPLYRGRGYQFVGEIPGYGFTTDGRLESTIIYYKQLT